MNDKIYKSSLVLLFVLCLVGAFFIYSSSFDTKQKNRFYNGKRVDYDLSMLNAYESSDLIQSKKLKRPLFKVKKVIVKKRIEPIKKVSKPKKKKIPFPKLRIKGIVFSSIPKAIIFFQNKERIVMEGEEVANWELLKIGKSELIFSLDGQEKRLSFGAQEFSQEGASSKKNSRPRFGGGLSGFPR